MTHKKKKKTSAKKFDFEAFREEAMVRLRQGDNVGGRDGIFAPLLQAFIQASLEGKMDDQMPQQKCSKQVEMEARIIDRKKQG